MKLYLGLFLTLLMSSASANSVHPIEQALSLCLSQTQNMTTAGMNECTYEATEAWDKELNNVYKQLMNALTKKGKESLKISQRQWLKFRDQEIEYINTMYNREMFIGTMYSTMRASDIMQLTKERTLQLTSYVRNH